MVIPMATRIQILPSILLLLLLPLFLRDSSLLCIASSTNSTTIYDELRSQGLPIGLLPKGITRYSINSTNGDFEVFMEQPCYAKFENEVHYDTNIKGKLGYGQIGELSGISAQELFLWFPVKGIRVDEPNSGVIHFDVGVADKQFSKSMFEVPPECIPQSDAAAAIAIGDGDDVLRAIS